MITRKEFMGKKSSPEKKESQGSIVKVDNRPILMNGVATIGLSKVHIRDSLIVCANCGFPLKNLKVTACETGTFYCSDLCCEEDVYEEESK